MTADPATEIDTAIGDQVLVSGTLMSGRRTLIQDGKQIDFLLVRIEGRKGPLAVPLDRVFRPSGERYILTATDFNPGLPQLARNIRRLRHSQNMTQYDFAQVIGVSQQAVGKWEAGKRGISLRHADRIAAALNVSVSELFGESK